MNVSLFRTSVVRSLAPFGVAARSLAVLLFVFASFSMAGCEKKVVGECSEDQPCQAFASCVDGECIVKKCSTSTDCGMEAHCDNGECVEGCQRDSDCYPGDECGSEGNCKAEGCQITSVDCEFGQYCDPSSGECYNASGLLCSQCSTSGDCGDGNVCIPWGSYGSYCGQQCSYDEDCPAGYMCLGLRDEFGSVVTTQCTTYCWLYGDSDDSMDGPPPPGLLADQRIVVDLFDGLPPECPAEMQ